MYIPQSSHSVFPNPILSAKKFPLRLYASETHHVLHPLWQLPHIVSIPFASPIYSYSLSKFDFDLHIFFSQQDPELEKLHAERINALKVCIIFSFIKTC